MLALSGAAPPELAAYRDLNRNGVMDPYENPALPVDARVDDLLARMTPEEKAGQLLHGTLPGHGSAIGASTSGYDLDKARAMIADQHVSSFITRLVMPPAQFAEQNNAVQKLAEATRLGIPATIAARAAGVMPTYVIVRGPRLKGAALEPVGAGFSKQLLNDLLRREKGYGGLIISDWAITRDCDAACTAPDASNPQLPGSIGMPWGVEHLSVTERFAKGLEAGLDQFGGVDDPAPILAVMREGKVDAARIDASVRRILRLKFELGLFENPFVDPVRAEAVLGDPGVRAQADAAQRAGQVLLRNQGALLPLRRGARLWLHGVDADAARAAGFQVVGKPEEADAALVRTATPFETLHPHHFFGSRQHEGRLDFRPGDADTKTIAAAARHVPVIVAVEMDRPAILTALLPHSRALLVTFGASDAALLDVVQGVAKPRGKLPFDLPRSMEDVGKHRGGDDCCAQFRRGEGLQL